MATITDTHVTEVRSVSILCSTDSHNYCWSSIHKSCECGCHYETKPHGGADLMNLSYNLWLISGGIDYLPEDEREGHYMGLIERAQSTVDLQGMSPAEAYVKLKPTLGRSYWSRWETLAELGLKEDW